MSRLERKLVALIAMAAVLFAQLAVAAYACPATLPTSAEPAASAHAPCDDVDPAQPNLCAQHCHDVAQTTDNVATPHPLLASTLVVRLVEPAASFVGCASSRDRPLAHSTSPPVAIRNCCLRI